MSDKGLKYAEETLGVHGVYYESRQVWANLNTSLNELTALRNERSDIQEKLADRRADLVAEERGKHPDMAVTRFEEHVKMQDRRDDEMRALRMSLSKLNGDIVAHENIVEGLKAGMRVLSGRMNELGGLLTFLASLKDAETSRLQSLQATEPTNERAQH